MAFSCSIYYFWHFVSMMEVRLDTAEEKKLKAWQQLERMIKEGRKKIGPPKSHPQ